MARLANIEVAPAAASLRYRTLSNTLTIYGRGYAALGSRYLRGGSTSTIPGTRVAKHGTEVARVHVFRGRRRVGESHYRLTDGKVSTGAAARRQRGDHRSRGRSDEHRCEEEAQRALTSAMRRG